MTCQNVLLEFPISNPKFGVKIHLTVSECHVLFSDHCDLNIESGLSSRKRRPEHISNYYEVEILNLV